MSLQTRLNKHLGEERFVRFLEHVVADGERPRSARLMLDRIAQLGSVQAALEEAERDREHLSTVLTIAPRSATRFRIRFGEVGNGVGDGGDWTVFFFTNGSVRRVIVHSFWVC